MAAIVLGIGTSQESLPSTAPGAWDELARTDRRNPALAYRGATYAWDELKALRGGAFAARNTPEARRAQWARCGTALDALAAQIETVGPEAVLIVGDGGEGPTAEYPPAVDLAAIVEDCARRGRFPVAVDRASGSVVRRLLGRRDIPLARLRFDPSALDAERCFALGAALGGAIRSWGEDRRVAVIAAGGLSHPVIDEELDRRLLEGFAAGDPAHIIREPEAMLRGGAAEVKTWIVAAGALDHAGLDMVCIDYVPCVRTEAGTGHAMAFAVWS
jgi:hypothetical protein